MYGHFHGFVLVPLLLYCFSFFAVADPGWQAAGGEGPHEREKNKKTQETAGNAGNVKHVVMRKHAFVEQLCSTAATYRICRTCQATDQRCEAGMNAHGIIRIVLVFFLRPTPDGQAGGWDHTNVKQLLIPKNHRKRETRHERDVFVELCTAAVYRYAGMPNVPGYGSTERGWHERTWPRKFSGNAVRVLLIGVPGTGTGT